MRREPMSQRRMRGRRSEIEPMERRVLLSGAAALAAGADLFGGHTYHVVLTPSPMTWADEETAARNDGGHLVSINSAGEQEFLQGLLAAEDVPTGSYSIGGIRTSTSPLTYGWSTGETASYTNWYAGEPNGADPVVAMIWTRTAAEPLFARRGQWNDEPTRGYLPSEQPVFTDLPRRGYIVEIEAEQETLEAEQATLTGAVTSDDHPGYTGTGFVDYLARSGDAAEFTTTVPTAGFYDLIFRYANGGSSPRPMGLTVNGEAVGGGVSFAPTGLWDTWKTATVKVPLTPGTNTVRLSATGRSGPNLDSLSVRRGAAGATTYQAESAMLSGPVAASDHPGFTGTGFADYQNPSADFAEFTIDVPSDGQYVLDFRYANGSKAGRALDLSVDGQKLSGAMTFAPTGAWTTWNNGSRTTGLKAGQHTVRLTATGSSGPNLDALTVTPVQ